MRHTCLWAEDSKLRTRVDAGSPVLRPGPGSAVPSHAAHQKCPRLWLSAAVCPWPPPAPRPLQGPPPPLSGRRPALRPRPDCLPSVSSSNCISVSSIRAAASCLYEIPSPKWNVASVGPRRCGRNTPDGSQFPRAVLSQGRRRGLAVRSPGLAAGWMGGGRSGGCGTFRVHAFHVSA